MVHSDRTLFLCGGLQSSGSTLVSWCFLQRSDMNGVLDGDNDLLPHICQELARPFAWYKTTICCFRLTELCKHFEDDGWSVRPLLVIRDVRRVWASLAGKTYARNGITAEDPPLRLRMRRFKQDWQSFCEQDWPTLRYESLVTDPEATLKQTCRKLNLPWDEAMLTWPKPVEQIANTRHGNRTFRATRGGSIHDTVRPSSEQLSSAAIPPADLDWLETEFHQFNLANNYPARLAAGPSPDQPAWRAVPTYKVTRRYKWELRRNPLRWLLSTLGAYDPSRKWEVGGSGRQ